MCNLSIEQFLQLAGRWRSLAKISLPSPSIYLCRLWIPAQGAGGVVQGRFSLFLLLFYKGEWQLPGTLTVFGMKKYCSYSNLMDFEMSKIDIITLHAQILIVISQKFSLNFNFSYSFWVWVLKLGTVMF